MKNKHVLQASGLQDIPPGELEYITGGGLFSFSSWIAGGVASSLAFIGKTIVDDWHCFKDGVAGNPCVHGQSH